MNYSVPGLARGIEILRLLETDQPLTLEAIAQRTGFPKASVFRLMETLKALGMVGRDAESKGFSPLVRLTDTAASDTSFDTALAEALESLATKTGQTAEWYIPMDSGLVMVQRDEPSHRELQVRARIGFVRHWNDELDAVACVGRAWREPPIRKFSSLWTYGEDGQRVNLTAPETRLLQDRARQTGHASDRFYNSNGVKRMAAVVLDGSRMRGVLAMAQCFTPQAARLQARCRAHLLETAANLQRNNPFIFKTGDLD